jgi:dihydrodipicolinate synthase/N-acetylneuraminate lyase
MRYALKRGGAGVLCPLPLIAPQQCLELYRLMQDGKLDEADEIQTKLLGALPLFSGLDMDKTVASAVFQAMARKPYTGPGERPASTVALVKEALRLQGHPISSVVRRPCPPLSRDQAQLVAKTMKCLGWI